MIGSVDVAKVIGSGREELNSQGTDAHLERKKKKKEKKQMPIKCSLNGLNGDYHCLSSHHLPRGSPVTSRQLGLVK
jgi:hypothetical protein